MEVTASLRSRGVFMSGERLRCDVAFVNTSPQGRQDLQSPGSVAGQTLAWASVQIQCLYQWTGGPGAGGGGPAKPDQIPGTSSTSLQTSGSGRLKPKGSLVEQIQSTAPKILFCDLTLGCGEGQSFEYEEVVPPGCPSTYHGKNIRFLYRLLVATQRVNQPIVYVKLPLRVLGVDHVGSLLSVEPLLTSARPPADHVASGTPDHQHHHHHHHRHHHHQGPRKSSEKPAITNPFAPQSAAEEDFEEADDTTVDSGWDHQVHHEFNLSRKSLLVMPTPNQQALSWRTQLRKKATFYDVKASKGRRVGKLCLFRTTYRLGEDIVGIVNFSEVDLDCMQYSVSLVGQETTVPAAAAVVLSSLPQQQQDDRPPEVTKAVFKSTHQEFCYGYEETSFSLAVPLSLTPSFTRAQCRLAWSLKFDFVISEPKDKQPPLLMPSTTMPADEEKNLAGKRAASSPTPPPDSNNSLGHEWNGPPRVDVETLTWSLPIVILATHPRSVSCAVHPPTSCTLKV